MCKVSKLIRNGLAIAAGITAYQAAQKTRLETGSFYGEPTSNAGGTVFGSMTTGLLAGDSAAAYVKGAC